MKYISCNQKLKMIDRGGPRKRQMMTEIVCFHRPCARAIPVVYQ